ncbi:nuclear mitotic apparatus protein 1 isoform X2 [Acipenser ruthenus]|uniref:nuclear mitotic apparatus protein 1 isoform X2 n=1 Tax=Acipenser ruthenus TaxID=7906 RepID=UPI0027429A36|nr:nuclear mitotic apparatus protein 1 isoform X2 [Acipenser ruthenus]
MALHETKELALLMWINSLNIEEPIDKISKLQEGSLLVKLIFRLNGKEDQVQKTLDQPLEGRWNYIANFLQSQCKYNPDLGTIVSWQNILNGKSLDVELSKVTVLLLYYSNMCGRHVQEFEKLNYKIQAELASVLRFVLDNEDHLYLNNNLERFLKRQVVFPLSSVSSMSSVSDDESPIFKRKRRTEVQFVDLHTVATSSVSSPIQDVLKTPQFQLRKMRKQMALERNMRDDLELELAASCKIITEKETQLCLLQQRLQRLVRQNDEQEPKELEELRDKNESLLKRLQDTLKQCQDLKTNKSQMERKVDQLTEENGELSYQMRDVVVRLTQAQHAVDMLSDEQEASKRDWESKRTQLGSELSQAIADKECLEERILILQGKISLLEEQLRKAMEVQVQETGEVMGDILQLEGLRQEVAELNTKLSQLQAVIAGLEDEKSQVLAQLSTERAQFESEKSQLSELISGLQQTLSDLGCEKEALECASLEQQETFSVQIETLNVEISKLSELVQQRELELSGLHKQIEEERRQKGQLVEEMEKQEQSAQETIHNLSLQVDELGSALKVKEEEVISSTRLWEVEREEGARAVAALQEVSASTASERDAVLMEYQEFQKAKEEEIGGFSQQIQTLEEDRMVNQSLIAELRREKKVLEQRVAELEATVVELRAKCQSLQSENEAQSCSHLEAVESLTACLREAEEALKEYEGKLAHHSGVLEENQNLRDQLATIEETVAGLRIELEAERQKFEEARSAELGKVSRMGQEVQSLESKTMEISAELELVRRELLEEREGKVAIESSLECLKEEGKERTNTLRLELEEALSAIKEKEAEIGKLDFELGKLRDQMAVAQEFKIRELAEKEGEIAKLIGETKQTLVELEETKKGKADMEACLQMSIGEHQDQLSALCLEQANALLTLKQRESELESLHAELSLKQEELRNQQESVLQLQKEVSLMETLRNQVAVQEKETQQYKQEAEVRDNEVQRLNTLLATKENEIKSFLQRIDDGEEKASVVQALHQQREVEIQTLKSRILELEQDCLEQKQAISVLEKEVADARMLLQNKTTAFDTLVNKLQDLQLELSQQQEKTFSLECRLEASESAKSEQESLVLNLRKEVDEARSSKDLLEKTLKEQASSFEQEIERQSAVLAKLKEQESTRQEEQKERDILRSQAVAAEEMHCKELEKNVEKLQAEVSAASTLASQKQLMAEHLQKDLIERQKEMDAQIIQVCAAKELQCRELEETIEKLQAEVRSTSSIASEREKASETFQKKLALLQQEMEKEKERYILRTHASATEESLRNDLEETTEKLRAEVSSASALASERELAVEMLRQELSSLHEEINKQKDHLRSVATIEEAQRKQLEETITVLQAEVRAANDLAAEREQLAETLQRELSSLQEEMKKLKDEDILRNQAAATKETQHRELEESIEKLRTEALVVSSRSSERERTVEMLQKELPSLQKELEKRAIEGEALKKEDTEKRLNVKLESDLASQNEGELTTLRQELTNAQALIGELMQSKRQCQQQQSELCLLQTRHQEELEQRERIMTTLEDELQQAKDELHILRPLREKINEQQSSLLKLQAENSTYKEQVCKLQHANSLLTSESLEICSDSTQGVRRFDAEMAKAREGHSLELEKLRAEHQRQLAIHKVDAQDFKSGLDTMSRKYEKAKLKILDDRQKFQEERQKLATQLDEMTKKLAEHKATAISQHQKVKVIETEFQEDVKIQRKQISDLQIQLTQKEQTLDHYKAQVEKAKAHYNSKKQLLQEALEQVQSLETALESSQRENSHLKTESKQLDMELQQSQLNAKNLAAKVSSLHAQVDYADRQLRSLGKFQVATDVFKSRESLCPNIPEKDEDVSKDSLDLSHDDADIFNSTRKPVPPVVAVTPTAARSSERLAAQRRTKKGESMESLYFTPLPAKRDANLESSIDSLGELTLNSSKKTRSARRRTTQVINITLTKKTPGPEPGSANTSFHSLQSAQSHPNLFSQRGRPVSTSSFSSCHYSFSQESLEEGSVTETLRSLPGYRQPPATVITAAPDRRSTNSFIIGSQNEPEHTDDWMRIAELQARNKACLPHLKTSYPLESRPTAHIPFSISDEDVKLGDPTETIRRASMLPGQIRDSVSSHRFSMLPGQIREGVSSHRQSLLPVPAFDPSWQSNSGVATRQQTKRSSGEPHKGGDTPESKKMASCFPRPMTPKDKNDRRYTMQNSQNKPSSSQADRRQSMSFSVLNTPKGKQGSNILQRGLNKMRASTRKSPNSSTNKTPLRSGTKSPLATSTKSPRATSTKFPKVTASTKKRVEGVSRFPNGRKEHRSQANEKHEVIKMTTIKETRN